MELLKRILLQDNTQKKRIAFTIKFSTSNYFIKKKIRIIIVLFLLFAVNANSHIIKQITTEKKISKTVSQLSQRNSLWALDYLVRFQVDPFSKERDWTTFYNYSQNNPLFIIDPIGLTDFTLDKNTGQLTQVGEKNQLPDRILKTDSKGNVIKKGNGFLGFLVSKSEKGKAKVDLDNIEQGILEGGMNLKENDNLIDVGGDDQASVKGFEDFALKFSNYIGLEVQGEYFSKKDNQDIRHISIGRYNSNTSTSAAGGLVPTRFTNNVNLLHTLQLRVHYHTHLSMFKDSDRIIPSRADLNVRASLPLGVKSIIITNPKNIDYSRARTSSNIYGSN